MKRKYFISYQFRGIGTDGFGYMIQETNGKFSLIKASKIVEKYLIDEKNIISPNVVILFYKIITRDIETGGL